MQWESIIIWPTCEVYQPLTHEHHLPQLRQVGTLQERLRRARQDLRQVEQRSRAEEQEVWKKGKGHHEEMVFV